jgi:hypothetical protein
MAFGTTMEIKEIKNIIPEKYNKLIHFIQSNNFPWYWGKESTTSDFPFHFYVVLRRKETGVEPRINSELYQEFIDMFEDIAKKNNIQYSEIYRICLNSTLYNPEKIGDPHTDHTYPHKNLLIYLEENSSGNTFLFKEQCTDTAGIISYTDIPKLNLLKEIEYEYRKGVIFNGLNYHAQGFPKIHQRRLVIVYTFI